MLSSRPGRFIP